MKVLDRVWIDGRMVAKERASLPCLSPGVLYGQGVFETMRCHHGKVFLFESHLKRLAHGSGLLGIAAPSRRRIREAVRQVIEGNRLREAAIRLNLCAGVSRNHLFVFARPLPDLRRLRARGLSACQVKDQWLGQTFLAGAKSFNRFFYEHFSALAKKKGFDEVFFGNSRGEVAEGSRSNIFIVRKGGVRTPPLGAGCLPGVTRFVAIDIMKDEGIPVREQAIGPGDLFSADEIWCTNALWGVLSVTRLDHRKVGKGKPGPVAQKIAQIYDNRVEKECAVR